MKINYLFFINKKIFLLLLYASKILVTLHVDRGS